ncbi:MAG: ABC transporter permease [Methylobacterium sp.]|nr:ABC transporter permease [Methylobacterium sp.]MCA3650579.1 ABC transporter permease [Methylobacterium sp.]MCA4922232.1 ABC transporter permease [Methylobacterium sp.]
MTDMPRNPAEPSRFQRIWESDVMWSFRHSPVAIVSAIVSLVMIFGAILAPLYAPQDPFNPASLNLMDGLTPPGKVNEFTGQTFLLGSDSQGRDMFSAVLYGTQVSLLVGAASVLFSAVVGVFLGLMAGYIGGKTEAVIMRVADVQLSFPAILIALLIFGVARGIIPPSQQEDATLILLILAIGLSNWAQYARTVRGSTLVEKNKEYVQAARVIGRSPLLIMLKHILPNVMGPVTVIATINLALAVIEEATLSFLGVGMPPTQPSLGTLIRVGQQFLFSGEWWILLFPALTLVILALAINLLGDWLRDAMNPRLR